MATKLKNLKIKKVDFVDEGANPEAHIRMVKRKDGEGISAAQTSGNGSVKVWKKLVGFIGKAAGMEQAEIDSAVEEIQKNDSGSFHEKLNEAKNRKIADEIWDICCALQSSLCSILNDDALDSHETEQAMQESLSEFCSVAQETIVEWSSGKAAGIAKKEEEEDAEPDSSKETEGDEEEMKLDKSRMTNAERAFLESLEKRYGNGDGQPEGSAQTQAEVPAAEPTVVKSMVQAQEESQQMAGEAGIYKGLHPAVRAELEELKKFREAAEEKELGMAAEKYAVIGKKKEELVPLFKSLKAAGGTAYSDMIAILDQAVETVEKSGAFSEIGKSGYGFHTAGAAETKIDTIAKGYMQEDVSLDYTAAVAKAWEDHPELVGEYETEAGF